MQKLALVGAGSIGQIHARNIAAHPGADLIAVCDVNTESAEALAAEHGCRALGSVREVLEREVDGVIIASSTASHGDVAAACATAKAPFLCEKPLASNVETARHIVNAARTAGIVAAMAFNRRFDAGYAGIKAAVDAGEIGQLETLLVTSRTATPPTVEFTRTSGGIFGEKGAHFYDIARWITGEHPVELFAMGATLIDPGFATIDEVDTAMLTMRMPSGALCQFDFSWRAAYGQDERLEVNGSNGMMQSLQAPVGAFVRSGALGQTHPGKMPGWYERFAPTYAHELDLFIAAIAGGDAFALPTLEDGLAAQQIADAAKRSVRLGQSVRLD